MTVVTMCLTIVTCQSSTVYISISKYQTSKSSYYFECKSFWFKEKSWKSLKGWKRTWSITPICLKNISFNSRRCCYIHKDNVILLRTKSTLQKWVVVIFHVKLLFRTTFLPKVSQFHQGDWILFGQFSKHQIVFSSSKYVWKYFHLKLSMLGRKKILKYWY